MVFKGDNNYEIVQYIFIKWRFVTRKMQLQIKKKKGSTFISEMEKLQKADSETGLFQQTWKTLTEGMTQESTSLK